ncbi:hypothetical protein D3C71_1680860 [compost metagenome]
MLARQATAGVNTELEDIVAGGFGARRILRVVDVVEDQRMHVAVAGVEDIGDAQAVARDDLTGAGKHMGELAERHGAVHADIVGDAAGGAEGGFPAFPDRGRFHGRLAFLDGRDPVTARDRNDAREHRIHLRLGAFDLDDQ